MRAVPLGRTGITVSRLGMGTGTAHPSGTCHQSLLSESALADLLLYAFERGITLWDTAVQYGTHSHIRRALDRVPRSQVTITTKLLASTAAEAENGLHRALRELGTDHVDVCLLHSIRSRRELNKSAAALARLCDLKAQGLTRAVGISCHGIDVLDAARALSEIEVVWARINYAGYHMDSSTPGLVDMLAAVPMLKKTLTLIPKRIVAMLRPSAQAPPVSRADFQRVTALLERLHAAGKGVIGMKILGEGRLADEPARALQYAVDRPFLDGFIVGMLTREEIETNCRLMAGVDG